MFEFGHALDNFCHCFQIGSGAHMAAGQLGAHVQLVWKLLPPLPQYTFVVRRLIKHTRYLTLYQLFSLGFTNQGVLTSEMERSTYSLQTKGQQQTCSNIIWNRQKDAAFHSWHSFTNWVEDETRYNQNEDKEPKTFFGFIGTVKRQVKHFLERLITKWTVLNFKKKKPCL
jgi:hypothetical protein